MNRRPKSSSTWRGEKTNNPPPYSPSSTAPAASSATRPPGKSLKSIVIPKRQDHRRPCHPEATGSSSLKDLYLHCTLPRDRDRRSRNNDLAYLRVRRTAFRKISHPSLHLSNLDRFFRLSGYSINDFKSSTTLTGITYHAFIGRAYATSASISSALYDFCS